MPPILKKTIIFCFFISIGFVASGQLAQKVANLSNLPENSGLEFDDGKLWLLEDSGNSPYLYAIDTASGAILQTLIVDSFDNIDWEDITADNEFLYVGDFGNNNGTRTDLRILKIKKSEIGGESVTHVNAKGIYFNFFDQDNFNANSRTNFDCEAIISVGDSLYIFTKNWGDFKSTMYALPKKVDTLFSLKPAQTLNVDGLITAADYDPLSGTIVLLGYNGTDIYPFLYEIKIGGGILTSILSEQRSLIENKILAWQTEAITFVGEHSLFLSNESNSFFAAGLYRISLPSDHQAAIENIAASTVVCYPNPSKSIIYIQSERPIDAITIYDLIGTQIYNNTQFEGNTETQIDVQSFLKGTYFIEIRKSNLIWVEKITIF